MPTLSHRFALVLLREDGTYVGAVAADRDWEPALEWTRFYWQRKDELPLDGDNGNASIVPLWDHKLGQPYCRGYRVEIGRDGRRPVTSDFPNSHFKEVASAAAGHFLKTGKLAEDEIYRYVVVAQPGPAPLPQAEGAPEERGLVVTNVSPKLPVRDAAIRVLLARARPAGVIDADDMPVFIPQRILDEIASQTRADQGQETGGILIGYLWRDSAVSEIFAEVTAQIPAEHTRSNEVKLTFTSDTWAAADGVLRLRGRTESYVGYWHSHPVRFWCETRQCSIGKQKTCHLAKDFFSTDDEAVMRAAFPRAYSVGLVANDTAFAGVTFSLFGYREGAIQPRGFYVISEDNDHAT